MTPPPAAGAARVARPARPLPPPPRRVPNPRRPVPAPERPRLEVVRGRPVPGRRPPRPLVLVVVAATLLALFALVAANVVLGQAGITEAELRARVAQKQQHVDQLSLEVERLSAPGIIAARAAALELVPAPDVVVIPATSSPSPGRP